MKCGGKTALWVMISVWCATDAKALVSGSGPYEAIVERNVFNIRPAPKAPSAEDLAAQNKPPPPKITLTGITTLLGKKVTFLTVPGTKPGAQPESMMLAEGQGQSEVEVKEIDEKAGIVRVVNHGVEQTLDFDQNGAKPTAPPPGSVPTPLQLPPPGAPPANVNPAPQNFIRPVRPGALPVRQAPLPSASMGGGIGGNVGVAQNQNESLTAEETAALITINTERYKMQNDPTYQIMPPIPGLTAPEEAPAPQ